MAQNVNNNNVEKVARQHSTQISLPNNNAFDNSMPSIVANLIENDQNRNEIIYPDTSKNNGNNNNNNFLSVRKFEIEIESNICKQEINESVYEYKRIDHAAVNQFIPSSSMDINHRVDGDSSNIIINNNRHHHYPEIKTEFDPNLSNENENSEIEIKYLPEYEESVLNYTDGNSFSNRTLPISDDDDNVNNLKSPSEYSNNSPQIVDSDHHTFSNSSGSEYVDSDDSDSKDDDYDDYVKVPRELSHNNSNTNTAITTTTNNNNNNTGNGETVKNSDNHKQIDPSLGFVGTLICLYATNNNVDYLNGLKINGDYLLPLLALEEDFIATTATTSIIDRSYVNNKVKTIVNVKESRIRRRRFKTLVERYSYRYRYLYDFLLLERKINYDDISDLLRTILPYDFTDNNFEFKFTYYRYGYRTIKRNRLILIVGRKYVLMAFDNDTIISNKPKLILMYDKAIIDNEQWWMNLNNNNNRPMLVPFNIPNHRRLDNIKFHSLRYYTLKDEIRDICRLFHERLPRRDRYPSSVNDEPDLNRLINSRKLIICRSYRDGTIGVSFSSYKFHSSVRGHAGDSMDSSYTVVPVQRMCLYKQEIAVTNEHGQQAIYICRRCVKRTTDKSEMYNHWMTTHEANLKSLAMENTYCQTIDVPQHFLKNKFASIIYPRNDTQQSPIDRSLVFISFTKNPIQFSRSIRSSKPITVYKPALAYKINLKEKSVLKTIYKCSHCHKQLQKFYIDSVHTRSYICPHCRRIFRKDDALYIYVEQYNENISDKHIKCRTNDSENTTGVQSLKTAVQDAPHNKHNATYLKIFLNDCYKYQCLMCSAIMKTEQTMKMHYKRIHSEPIYECNRCPKKMATLGDLRRHMKSVHSRSYVCSQCPKAFGALDKLKRHEMNIHSSENKYKCDICGIYMKHSETLAWHKKRSHNDALYIQVEEDDENVCDKQITCGTNDSENTTEVQSLNTGVQDAPNNQHSATYLIIFLNGCYKYQCLICSAIMKTEQTMKMHYKRIHSEPIYGCTRCPKKVATLGALKMHIKSVHSRTYVCSQCPKAFGTLYGLKLHEMSVHTPGKKCKCDICGKNMENSRLLAQHKDRMHNFKPKSCKICNRLCTTQSIYFRHSRSCGKKKVKRERYICDICKKSYFSKDILKNHLNQHLNVKPYKCNVCGTSFSNRSYLASHRWVHRDKSFSCPVCNKVFKRNFSMKSHLKTQHSNEQNTNLHACVE